MYMLNSVGDRTPPCGTPVLNCSYLSECGVCFASFDVVCDEFLFLVLSGCMRDC